MKKLMFLIGLPGLILPWMAYSQSPPKNGKTCVIAHRGAHIGIPENSLAAYQKAIDLGCDFVEIDIRTTKDHQFVSVHNNSIDAYAHGQSGKVKDMTLAELKALDIGARVGEEWKNTQIPTFEEILKLCQGQIGIYLDLKEADPTDLIKLIRKYDMEEDVVWFLYGLDRKNILKIKNECPKCLPMPDPGKEKNLSKLMKVYQPKIVASGMKNCTQSFTEKVHDQGAVLYVDDSEDDLEALKNEWEKMYSWGIDGIQTDRPEELISWLNGLN